MFLRGSMIEMRKWDLIEGLVSAVRSMEARVGIVHRHVGDCLNLPLNASDVMSDTYTARCQQPRRSSDYSCLLVRFQLIEHDRIAPAFIASS